MRIGLVYPHQLYVSHPVTSQADSVLLIEEPLLISQYRFHAKKLALHFASMQRFADQQRLAGKRVDFVSSNELTRTEAIGNILKNRGASSVIYVDPCDDWLGRRLQQSLRDAGLAAIILPEPNFLTSDEAFQAYVDQRKKLYFTDFYIQQRKRLGILIDADGGAVGGKWSFDTENRKKLPKGIAIPNTWTPPENDYVRTALQRVRAEYPNSLGDSDSLPFPTNAEEARLVLRDFLQLRFASFGEYEDAIDRQEPFLFHSMLTPALNVGLISPSEIVSEALKYAPNVPMNSLEGFVRQIIGWREYILGVYRTIGRKQRTSNFWGHSRPMPSSFYDGTTGIEPVDVVIRRVLKHAYCHHIERLMVLGNFMLLCEIHPDHVYQWFMELFIDAYDWVMVPNVYGMSQFADGGRITTKPYISGSSYILRMSNFSRGSWCAIWDALYWRFIARHRDFFASNPRMKVMVSQLDRLGSKLKDHLKTSEAFLAKLHGSSTIS